MDPLPSDNGFSKNNDNSSSKVDHDDVSDEEMEATDDKIIKENKVRILDIG